MKLVVVVLSKTPVLSSQRFLKIEDGSFKVIFPAAPMRARGPEGNIKPASPQGAGSMAEDS